MRIIGKSLFGSQNYHLDDEQSDKDYKLFVAPEFIDLYNRKDKFELPDSFTEHFSVMDIRKYDSLLRKGNVNAVEYLFSTEFGIFDKKFEPYFELARKVFSEGYVGYVWNCYFQSAKGLILNSIRRKAMNDTEESQRKFTARGFWMINFLSYLIKNNYKITDYMWNCPAIYKFPREIRYGEDAFTSLTEAEWLEMFEYIEIMAMNNPCTIPNFILQNYNNQLMLCAQNTIADAIRIELEDRW